MSYENRDTMELGVYMELLIPWRSWSYGFIWSYEYKEIIELDVKYRVPEKSEEWCFSILKEIISRLYNQTKPILAKIR